MGSEFNASNGIEDDHMVLTLALCADPASLQNKQIYNEYKYQFHLSVIS